ncbi:MAG: nickel pincer cofactor biosynthesis protein LarC [Limnochordia bacterium]
MRIAYFDCFSGISGNMILGALVDAGVSLAALESDLHRLNLPGWELKVTKDGREGITGTHVEVVQTTHEHVHRTIGDIEDIVSASELPEATKKQAMEVFEVLAEAEGRVHGVPATEVHFHEVGAIDAIVDIVGAISGLAGLDLDAVYASPVHLGRGFVRAAHGTIPVPAPATLEILRGVPVYSMGVRGELTTPTGAAILKTVVSEYGPWPQMTVDKIGYGLGTKHFSIPNVLRLAIGTSDVDHDDHHHHDHEIPGLHGDHVEILEADIDDMNPECGPHVIEQLLAAGALDAYFTPIVMKKGRPALKLTVLSPPSAVEACVTTALRETTTLGVRSLRARRHKLHRDWIDVQVAGRPVRVKLGRWNEEVVNIAPEYEDCRRTAQAAELPLKLVYDRAKTAAYVGLQAQ